MRGVSNHTTGGEVGASGDEKLNWNRQAAALQRDRFYFPARTGHQFTMFHENPQRSHGSSMAAGNPPAFSPPGRDWGKMVSETDSS